MGTSKIRIGLALILVVVALSAGQALAQPNQPGGGLADPSANDFLLDNRDLVIRDGANRVRLRLDAQTGDIRIFDVNGDVMAHIEEDGSNIWQTNGGDFVAMPPGAIDQTLANASVHIDGDTGTQWLGGAGTDGQLVWRDAQGRQRVFVSAETAALILGQEDEAGNVFVRDANGNPMVTLNGDNGRVLARDIFVQNNAGENMVTVNGNSGQFAGRQIVSAHSTAAGTRGIDTASIYVQSRNPAVGLLDNTDGNTDGWVMQASSGGALSFSAGDTDGLSGQVFVLQPDGDVCIGACD